MEDFFKENDLENLQPAFQTCGISEEDFFSLDESQIRSILEKNPDSLSEFLSKYNREKGYHKKFPLQNIPNEHCNKDTLTSQEDISTYPSKSSDSENVEIDFSSVASNAKDFAKNETYYFLSSSSEGLTVLGKYKKTKILDYSRLKNLIIFNELNKDLLNYKIKAARFVQLTKELVELFPTEDSTVFYTPHKKSEDETEQVCARGSLYNYYKVVRKELKDADILIEKNALSLSAKEREEFKKSLLCATDCNQQNCNLADRIQHWQESHKDRAKLLTTLEGKKYTTTLSEYFSSFANLRSPYGILLLEVDFEKVIQNYKSKNLIPKENIINYSTALSDNWPELSSRVVKFCKKSRIVAVKEFFSAHEKLIAAGTHNHILGLFLLPLYIKATFGKKEEAISKQEIADSFILHVEEENDLEERQKQFEEWHENRSLEVHPYLICTGKLENAQFSVILNGEKYVYTNPVKAVEDCYKCLTGLQRWPTVSGFVWNFFHRAIYELNFKKASQYVTTLITELNKQKKNSVQISEM